MPIGRKQPDTSTNTSNAHQSPIPETNAPTGNTLRGGVVFNAPERSVDMRAVTRQLPLEVRAAAAYKDPAEGRVNALDVLERGEPLSERGLKQLWHGFDLAEHSRANPKSLAQKALLDQGRRQLQDALAHNDFLRVLQAPGQNADSPTFTYKGLEFPKAQGVELMRREHETFRNKDRWLNMGELGKIKSSLWQTNQDNLLQNLKNGLNYGRGKLPLEHSSDRRLSDSEKIQKAQELYRESGGRDYYIGEDASNNYMWGAYSNRKPVRIKKLEFPELYTYTESATSKPGQDIIGNLDMLTYSQDSEKLKYAFFQTKGFQEVYNKVKKTGKTEHVVFETLRVPTGTFPQASTIGKVKVRFEGNLSRGKNGKVRVFGKTSQGSNAEVFTFPRGNRGWLEGPNEFGRSLNWTNFRTILEGEKDLDVYLD